MGEGKREQKLVAKTEEAAAGTGLLVPKGLWVLQAEGEQKGRKGRTEGGGFWEPLERLAVQEEGGTLRTQEKSRVEVGKGELWVWSLMEEAAKGRQEVKSFAGKAGKGKEEGGAPAADLTVAGREVLEDAKG